MKKKRFECENIVYSITCSPIDPLQWIGGVRMKLGQNKKNIYIIFAVTSCKLMDFIIIIVIIIIIIIIILL